MSDSNDLHHVHSRVCDTRRRPTGESRTGTNVPDNIPAHVYQRARQILNRQYPETDDEMKEYSADMKQDKIPAQPKH